MCLWAPNPEWSGDRDGVPGVCFSSAWSRAGSQGGLVNWKNGECEPALASAAAEGSHLPSPGRVTSPHAPSPALPAFCPDTLADQ